mmetsp:Transcript_7930/g.13628  ORF Transcript_7930/g.13628 Transcript_7930/m.13628 type:complete len:228 (-) Transcript_7930:754-1437(-)
MMLRAHICARRNSRDSMHAKHTSFHVRVLLALRAASTAAWYWPSLTRQDVRREKLDTLVNRILAASYRPCSKHLSPITWICPTLGAATNSSSSLRRLVLAYAYISSESMDASLTFLRAISRYFTRSSKHEADSAALMTSAYAAASFAFRNDAMASETMPCSSWAFARLLHTSGSLTRSANSKALGMLLRLNSSTFTADTFWWNFLKMKYASSYSSESTAILAMSGPS